MLRRYLSCKYKIFNEINEEKLKLKRIELKTNDKLRIERGNILEKETLQENIPMVTGTNDIKKIFNVLKFFRFIIYFIVKGTQPIYTK